MELYKKLKTIKMLKKRLSILENRQAETETLQKLKTKINASLQGIEES